MNRHVLSALAAALSAGIVLFGPAGTALAQPAPDPPPPAPTSPPAAPPTPPPPDPTTDQTRAATRALYLDASDLPQPMTRTEEPKKSREPEAKQHGGAFLGRATWSAAPDQVIGGITDSRWFFPGDDEAQKYMQQEASKLSDGMPAVSGAPSVGSESSVHGPSLTLDGKARTAYDFVFRVRNVVVKLQVVQGESVATPQLTPAMIEPIAQKIAARVTSVLDGNVPAPPAPIAPPPEPEPTPPEPTPPEPTPAPSAPVRDSGSSSSESVFRPFRERNPFAPRLELGVNQVAPRGNAAALYGAAFTIGNFIPMGEEAIIFGLDWSFSSSFNGDKNLGLDGKLGGGFRIHVGPLSLTALGGVGQDSLGGSSDGFSFPVAFYWYVEARARLQLGFVGLEGGLGYHARGALDLSAPDRVANETRAFGRLYYGPVSLGLHYTDFSEAKTFALMFGLRI